MKSIRILAPTVAFAVVVATGVAALGNRDANAQQMAVSGIHVAQTAPTIAPTQALESTPDAEVNDATVGGIPHAEADDTNVSDASESETAESDGVELEQDEAAEAAALAANVIISTDQANATALAANPGMTVTKTELDDEDGMVVYSVGLSNGTEVKVDAQSGVITSTDLSDSDNEQDGETQDGETQEGTAATK